MLETDRRALFDGAHLVSDIRRIPSFHADHRLAVAAKPLKTTTDDTPARDAPLPHASPASHTAAYS